MSTRKGILLLGIGLLALTAWLASCGPTQTAAPRGVTQAAVRMTAAPILVTVPPAAQASPPAEREASPAEGAAGAAAAPAYFPAAADRMIIKNAELDLVVDDTDVALARITGIAVQYGGYLLSSQVWYDDGYKEATVVIGVPSNSYEQALNRVREVATRVEAESASGQDVTDQYVDLESQLRNLEATAARLRSFLDKAQTVEEALQVNTTLSEIEGQIEKVKGQMNYIEGRSAFSTISAYIRPPRPTPTPTPTPTVTPTPTATPTPTPLVWQPGETAEQATNVLGAIGRFAVEALIWIGLVVLPVVGVPVLLIVLIGSAVRRGGKKASRE